MIAFAAASFRVVSIAQEITVDQLEQKLAAPAQAVPGPTDVPLIRLQDARLALQIENLQLSERLTPATLDRILKAQAFGPQTQNALQLLADRSALLDPPASELPNQPPPDENDQLEMLDASRVYVIQTLSRLPNFFATRTTYRFFGIPPELNQTGLPMYVGLHPRGSYSREITYRDGAEVLNPMKVERSEPTMPQNRLQSWSHSGLETRGEFGPELAAVLMDSAKGTIAFHHWEQGSAGVVAVFRYSVPEPFSHYEVNNSCNGSNFFHARPGYHGTLAIDPDSGAVVRITLQADWKPEDPISHVASVIDYGPVDIGGRTYICPVRSLAMSVEESGPCTGDIHNRSKVQPLNLNRTTFTNYHRLASTHRIITDSPPTPEEHR